MLRTFFVFVALFMLTLVFAAFTPPASAQERPPLVVNVYSFTDMADVNPWDAVSRVVAPGEPAVEYHFDPALEIDKANGCHPAQVRRMSVVTFISSWCQATE